MSTGGGYVTLFGDGREAAALMHQLGMQCLRSLAGEEDAVELASPVRQRWLDGLCPCCGQDLQPWIDSTGRQHEVTPVAEGVLFCGRCAGQRHHEDPPWFLAVFLRALAPPPPPWLIRLP